MKRITFIVGLPASGKTTYAHQHYSNCFIVDDPISLDDLPKNCPEHLVLTDPYFCSFDEEYLKKIIQGEYFWEDLLFSYVYFENDLEQCLINAKNPDRSGKKVDGMIRHLSKHYFPPVGAIPVYKAS